MDGIVVGCDISQDWMLPWWWHHYQKHNNFPVAFVDFGMSFERKEWCKARGQYIRLKTLDFATERKEMDPADVQKMEAEFGIYFWESRNAWFKKPFACLKSPFERTIWVDLDCEVRDSLKPLFAYTEAEPRFAIAKDQIVKDPPRPPATYTVYNSGVIAFHKQGLPLIEEWAAWCVARNHTIRGDQEVLSQMIGEKGLAVTELPEIYNWSRCQLDHGAVKVFHWHGGPGKYVIRHQIGRLQLEEPS
jgi:hypothetical protein